MADLKLYVESVWSRSLCSKLSCWSLF